MSSKYDVYITGDRIIKSLKTKCDNTSNGCEWIGELRSLDKHLLSCDFTLLPCPNQCKKDGEILKLLRNDIEKHTKEECPRRQYECPHCKETGEYQERITTHYEDCPNVKIPCPNIGCHKLAKRWEIPDHRKECKFELVPCKYVKIGCKNKVPRKDIRDHEGESQLHLQLAIDTVHRQDSDLKEMGDMLAQLKLSLPQAIKHFKFKTAKFDQLKKSSKKMFSPAFYTSLGGYKMCIRVDVKGDGDGEGTHVSVFTYLMRGENDDHLPWPFTGTVTVELLNQLEDKNHYSEATTFPQDSVASPRVMEGERAPTGLGQRCYIPHTSLGYDEAKHCQYLKDDCLYFRVKVDAETTTKPWLV